MALVNRAPRWIIHRGFSNYRSGALSLKWYNSLVNDTPDSTTLPDEMGKMIVNRFSEVERTFCSYPLDAKPITREDGKRRYELTFHLDHQDLVRLARVVHEHAADFPEFMRKLANKRLLVADRKDVLKSFGYDLFDEEDGLPDSEYRDAPPQTGRPTKF